MKTDKFYAGGGLIYGRFLDQIFGVGLSGGPFAAFSGRTNARLSQKKTMGGFGFGGFAGHRWDFGNTYLAELEALAQLQNTSLKHGYVRDRSGALTPSIISIEMTKKETLGLMGRFGKEVAEDKSVSLGFGLATTRFSINFRGVNAGKDNLSTTKNKYAWGLRFGAGYAQNITSEWTVRADYVYTQYQKFSVTGKTYEIGNGTIIHGANMSPSPNDHLLMVSLAYEI